MLILLIILAFLVASIVIITKSNQTNTNVNISGGYSDIKQLIEHYGCKYNNDTYREKREFPTEVNLVFKKKLYENYSNLLFVKLHTISYFLFYFSL